MSETNKKPRRKFRKSLLLIPVVIALIAVAAITIPKQVKQSRLRALGYETEEIEAIMEASLEKYLLDNSYYSEHLADAIRTGTLNMDYFNLYLKTPLSRRLSSKDFYLYHRLIDEGYEEDQIENLYAQLEFREIVPLLIFDYQWNEQNYIDDVISHRQDSKDGAFILDGDYLTLYKLTDPAVEPRSPQTLVNKRYYLGESFFPELVDITPEYSVAGTRLETEAAEAAVSLCTKALNDGNPFFISSSYRNYESLRKTYEFYTSAYGEDGADELVVRPGFSEVQTGFALSFAPTYEDEENFEDTKCYKWLRKNAASFGFIERYKKGTESLTSHEADGSYWRYVGRDLARSVSASGLTYDEYWSLVFKGWYDEENKPSEELIEKAIEEISK